MIRRDPRDISRIWVLDPDGSAPRTAYCCRRPSSPSGAFVCWESTGEFVTANAAVQAMDRRTHQGLATGLVALPRRSVHPGVWLRLLRTLLDEVNTPISLVRSGLGPAWRPSDHLPQHPHPHRRRHRRGRGLTRHGPMLGYVTPAIK